MRLARSGTRGRWLGTHSGRGPPWECRAARGHQAHWPRRCRRRAGGRSLPRRALQVWPCCRAAAARARSRCVACRRITASMTYGVAASIIYGCSLDDLWLQPRLSMVAASMTYGCSLDDLWLQPRRPMVAASTTYGCNLSGGGLQGYSRGVCRSEARVCRSEGTAHRSMEWSAAPQVAASGVYGSCAST